MSKKRLNGLSNYKQLFEEAKKSEAALENDQDPQVDNLDQEFKNSRIQEELPESNESTNISLPQEIKQEDNHPNNISTSQSVIQENNQEFKNSRIQDSQRTRNARFLKTAMITKNIEIRPEFARAIKMLSYELGYKEYELFDEAIFDFLTKHGKTTSHN